MNLFFIFALIMLSILYGIVGIRIIPTLQISYHWKIVFWSVLTILALMPITPIILRSKGIENNTVDYFSWAGYISLGFIVLTFLAVVTKDFIYLAIGMITKLTASFGYSVEPADPDRRDFIQKMLSIGILTTTGLSTGVGLYNARKGARIIKETAQIKNLGNNLNGLKIAQISDLHVGPTIKKGYVEEVVEQVNNLNPDIIAITGDMVDGSVKYLKTHVEPLKDLNAKIGKYFVTGNHEYYSGVDQWLDETDRLGFTNLIDDHNIISQKGDSFALGGVTDYRSSTIKPAHETVAINASSKAPTNLPKILLAHQPMSIFNAHKAKVDLQLSGHTHGGQFWPFVYAVRLANPYTAGLHNHDGTLIYVNRGTGYWGPPMRIGVDSEITLITLQSKKNEFIHENS